MKTIIHCWFIDEECGDNTTLLMTDVQHKIIHKGLAEKQENFIDICKNF
jgi:hypothetical protein